jgi:hypothetical protein
LTRIEGRRLNTGFNASENILYVVFIPEWLCTPLLEVQQAEVPAKFALEFFTLRYR